MRRKVRIIRKFDANKNMVYYKDSEQEVYKKFNKDNKLIYSHGMDSILEHIKTIEYNDNIVTTHTVINSVTSCYPIGDTLQVHDLSTNHVHIKELNELEIDKFYDDNNNLVHFENNRGYICDYEYNDHAKEIYSKSRQIVDGEEHITEKFTEYDDNDNKISVKTYEDAEFINEVTYEYKYFENGDYEIHKIFDKDNESWELIDKDGNILHYKDPDKEYWNEIKGNKKIYRNDQGYKSVTTYNDNHERILFKDFMQKIKYIYEDEYLQ